METGWVIIFIMYFNHLVNDSIELSSVNQETDIVYKTLKECSANVLEVARKKMIEQRFGVAYYRTAESEEKERIEVTTLDQSSSTLINHHKFTCLKITGLG